MLKIILSGCNGYMGRVVSAIVGSDPELSIIAGFDINTVANDDFPVYNDFSEYDGTADAVVDFSNASALEGLLAYCLKNKTPLVLCTTGHSDEQMSAINEAAKKIPIFKSGNMSLGVNLLADLVRRACEVLGESFDVEIIERHHRRKVDAPSGTALLLADAASSALPYSSVNVFERQSRRAAREKQEIGISAVRGGTIVGEHEVIFAGLDEVIELKHSAASRDVFAAGAIRAAKFIAKTTAPGIYNMGDLLGNS